MQARPLSDEPSENASSVAKHERIESKPRGDARERYTFITPVKLSQQSGALDLDRLFNVAARSIQRFFQPELLARFVVVADGGDLKRIEARAAAEMPEFPFDFVDQASLCPALGRPDDGGDGVGWQGWHKQQVLKIAAASIVRTPFYITMDDDVVLTRSINQGDLLRNEKLILEHISLGDYPQYVPWYHACCNVLEVSTGLFSSAERVMGFTPQIVITALMVELQAEIQTIWPKASFDESLLQLCGVAVPLTRSRILNRSIRAITKRRAIRTDIGAVTLERCRHWTEHQLYWTFLKKRGLADLNYTVNAPQLSAFGFWKQNAENSEIDAYIAREFDQEHDHYFSVIGSRVKGLDRKYLYQQIATRLG